ncbi:MAG: bifunctional nuclease family protein [Chitinophagales bacterium]|nr:bifunctional nuclease family protein [Bacteroidota bacterium]MCB9044337.1 bifunctional nuclease family protein [Chitinophagales bacterium]
MHKIELEIYNLSQDITQGQSYAVVLSEKSGRRRLPVIIGVAEAQAIAVAMEKMNTKRPLTHDLMKNLMQDFNIDLVEVIINNLLEGVFFAKLICSNQGKVFEIDSRTSDAIALAVRFNCPIYTYEFILDQAGLIIESPIDGDIQADSHAPDEAKVSIAGASSSDWQNSSLEQLKELLSKALSEEDYEKAARLRDEITRRGGN